MTAGLPDATNFKAAENLRKKQRSVRSLWARHWRTVALLLPGLLFLGGLQIYPFLSMLNLSFYEDFPGPPSFTAKHYTAFIEDPYFLWIMVRTLMLAILTATATAVIGYPVAYYLVKSNSRFKHVIFLIVVSPLLVSIVVRTIGWTIVLGTEGLVNNMFMSLGIIGDPLRLLGHFSSALLGLVHVLLPFMVLSISSVIGKIDPALSEAAAISGANPVQTFTRVTLPLSVRGIAAGAVIVFCLTIGSYVTPVWLGQGKVLLMSMLVYDQMLVFVEWPAGAAAGVILTLAAIAVLFIYALLMRRLEYR